VLAALGVGIPKAAAFTGTVNVTATPIVQQDLTRAAKFWQTVSLPDGATATPACLRLTIVERAMTPAQGNNSVVFPARFIWAETALGGCTIALSPAAWASRHEHPVAFCVTIAHEYGHALGVADVTAIPVMADQPANGADAFCLHPPR
jgi:hypothetical protein